MTRLTLALALVFVISWTTGALADGGAGVGNGGDRIGLEFVSLAQRVSDEIKTVPEAKLGFPPARLQQAIVETAVESTDEPLLVDGAPKTAKNFPHAHPPLIRVNRAEWSAIRNGFLRERLVLHEYLGIIGLEGNNDYHISSKFYGADSGINACDADERNLWDKALAHWIKSGHPVTRDNIAVGNGGQSTVDGTRISVIRGYEIYHRDGKRWMKALLYVAQCNSATGLYEKLMYSGSGAGFYPVPPCIGQNRKFCVDEGE